MDKLSDHINLWHPLTPLKNRSKSLRYPSSRTSLRSVHLMTLNPQRAPTLAPSIFCISNLLPIPPTLGAACLLGPFHTPLRPMP